MQNSFKVSKTLYFTSFRYINLIYSIPLTLFFIIGFVKLVFYLETTVQLQLPEWFFTFIAIFGIIIFTVLIVKIFFMLNLRRISLSIDDEGFFINNKEKKKKYWSQVKWYTFSKDKYESKSNSPASTVILSFGFMKAFIINCSTWTLLSKTRRREEQEAFAEFKQALVYYCR